MQESKGKQRAREFIYRECAGKWLAPDVIPNSGALTLLGYPPRELPLIDELGFQRNQVWSIERDLQVYRAQFEDQIGVGLYHGELADYLQHTLHGNQTFCFMNLDVEGSYRSQLDPAMTSVLLFCWRNANTVVTTYSTIGRDTEMIFEGIVSLAFFLALAPRETQAVYDILTHQYGRAGFEKPQRMALRELFWLRSIWEHSIAASALVGSTPLPAARLALGFTRQLWQRIVNTTPRLLTLSALLRFVRQNDTARVNTVPVGLCIERLQRITYNGEQSWSELCHCFVLKPGATMTSNQWLIKALDQLGKQPLNHIGYDGVTRTINSKAAPVFNGPLWLTRALLHFTPRLVKIPQLTPYLAGMAATIKTIRRHNDTP